MMRSCACLTAAGKASIIDLMRFRTCSACGRVQSVPAYAHDRIRWALFKPRLLPGCTAPLPPVLTNRVHAFRRVVAGALDECMKVLQARIPNVEQHLRPGDRHEFHP